MKCVYKLKSRDKEITEFYIGSSMNYYNRKTIHKCNSNNLNRREYCYPLYMFINVNGGFENWEFEVIKEYKFITKKELNMNEQYYKDLLKPHLNERNAYGLDIERNKNTHNIQNKFKANCPFCCKEMIKKNINKHLKLYCKKVKVETYEEFIKRTEIY